MDIRYPLLVSEGFDNLTIRRAITDGLDESGAQLDS